MRPDLDDVRESTHHAGLGMERTDVAKDSKVIAERLVAAAGEGSGPKGGRVRSPLYGLLWDEYQVLAPALNPPRTPNWEAVAREAAAAGVLDGRGQMPKAATVQKTWSKVVDDKDRAAKGLIPAKRRRRKAGDLRPPLGPDAPAKPASTPHPTAPDDAFKIVRAGGPRDWNKKGTDDAS